MTRYRVSFDISLDFDIEVEAENEEFAIEKAIDDFWQDTLAYVDIYPEDAEVVELIQ